MMKELDLTLAQRFKRGKGNILAVMGAMVIVCAITLIVIVIKHFKF